MFKIDRKFVDKIIEENETIVIIDMVLHIEVYSKRLNMCTWDVLYQIDFDNCLLKYYTQQISTNIFIPEEIKMISVEEKLTYNLPEDMIFQSEYSNFIYYVYEKFRLVNSKNIFKIEEISVDIQLDICNIVLGCEVRLKY